MTDTLPTPAAGMQQEVEQLVKGNPAADLDRAKAMTVGEPPLIQDPTSPFVDLPRGLVNNGTWQTRAMVRELTGVDEEAMARVKEVAEVFDTVLALATTRIGDLDLASLPLVERQGHLSQLLIGERDMLYIGIIKMTYGQQKKMFFTCTNPSCKERQELTVDLDEDFPTTIPPDVAQTDFEFRTVKGDHIKYRPAIGADQAAAFASKGATMAEQNSVLLSRCIKTVNGDLVVDPLLYARSLGVRDRSELLSALVSHQPTVDMTVKVDCVACREEQVFALGWADLFQP